MTNLTKAVLAAGLSLASLAAPAALLPAAAQTVQGIGVVNLSAVVANSNAYRTAQQQRPVTYKTQIDQANARRQAITTQLQPMVTKLQADSQRPNPNQQALQQQAMQIQQIEQNGQRELQQILGPVAMSQAYVEEQIQDKLQTAVETAARQKRVSIVLTPETVVYADTAYNMNQAVLDALNTLVPSAQLVPPQGWVPREIREQQAAAQAAQGAQPAQPAAQAPRPAAGGR